MANNSYKPNSLSNYYVDIVFCIDCTGSMQPLLDMIKHNALSMYDDISARMSEKRKHIKGLRVKIVAFRDYVADAERAMLVTDFFRLPEQSADLADCVNSLYPDGGGDIPEDGLEALAFAMKSNWYKEEGTLNRQIIVVWSDAPTHPLGWAKENGASYYPTDIPKDFNELTDWWGEGGNSQYMDNRSKRLVLFTPDDVWWSTIVGTWKQVVHFPSKGGEGLNEISYDRILDVIANSIALKAR